MRKKAQTPAASRHKSAGKKSQTTLRRRLEARRLEIEQAIVARVHGIADPGRVADVEYVQGLRNAVPVAFDYALSALGRSEDAPHPVPTALLEQARAAARNGIGLDTVIRRYQGGHALFSDFLMEEAEQCGLGDAHALKPLFRLLAARLDALTAAVGEAYSLEAADSFVGSEQHRARRIQRLLDGELIDTSDISYDFGAHHLGVVGKGPGVSEAIRELAKSLDRRLLLVRRGETGAWAWLGGRRPTDPDDVPDIVRRSWPDRLSLGLGEPGEDLAGWRHTHRQASTALLVALHEESNFVRYSNDALRASMLQDEVLAKSLRDLYLAPLEGPRNRGDVLRETLRAYSEAKQNISSAASTLGVHRHTVADRLRTVEERIGRPLSTCTAEMDAALSLEELQSPRNAAS
jgi:hypothetical protein